MYKSCRRIQKKKSKLGQVIIVSVKSLRNKFKSTSKVKKGEIYKAIIVRTKKKTVNKDGSLFFFEKNAVSLVNKQGKPVASRLMGPVPKKLKKGKFSKFASISVGVV